MGHACGVRIELASKDDTAIILKQKTSLCPVASMMRPFMDEEVRRGFFAKGDCDLQETVYSGSLSAGGLHRWCCH